MVQKIRFCYIDIARITNSLTFLSFLSRLHQVEVYALTEEHLILRVVKSDDDFNQIVKDANILAIDLYKDKNKEYGKYNDDTTGA